ncbi:MAG: hypothetical protein ACTFAK_16820 [Candidatus Electronema sp. VV]
MNQEELPEHMPKAVTRKARQAFGNLILNSEEKMYTDFCSACKEVPPLGRHFYVGKHSRKTSRIERFNLTLRQKISSLKKKFFIFRKNEKSYRTVLDFIPHYNKNIDHLLSTPS